MPRPFRMPTPVSIMGRSSSITNSFINSIIPVIPPTDEEIAEALAILGMDASDVRCAYCGDPATEWDHLRPLVVDQRPTGFVSEIGNLVPACGKCNQSKGNKPWREWIQSGAPRCPATRGIADLEARVRRLSEYEQWRPPTPVDFEALVGDHTWTEHWENWSRVLAVMQESQTLATEIRTRIRAAYTSQGVDPVPIPNEQLRADRMPPPQADWEAIQPFALTFNGYTHWGSFERCAEIADARRHETLIDLRTCLFFEQRRWRHYGYAPDEEAMEYIHDLVEQIRARVTAANCPPA